MKFNIAAKVGLLAAVVSLLMTALVGWWALGRSGDVLNDQARRNLIDDARLRVYDLVTDFRYLRKDVRDLANPVGMGAEDRVNTALIVKNLLTPTPDPAARRSLEELFTSLLQRPENAHYLELACLNIRRPADPVAVLAIGRSTVGGAIRPSEGDLCRQDKTALALLIEKPRDSKRQLFPVRALLRAGAEGEATPMLLTVAFPVGTDVADRPEAMLMLTIDFEEFVRRRARLLPRHLLFLTDDKGRLLVHPNPAVQERIRRASAGLAHDDLTVHEEP